MANLATLNLSNLGKPTVTGITNKNLVPSSVSKIATSSPAATSTKPTTISTPSVKTPAAQTYINSQMPSNSGSSFNDQLEAIKQSALAIKAKIPGAVQSETSQVPVTPQKQEKTSYQKAMDSYLEAMGNSLKIGDRVTKTGLDARREYNSTLDAPGGLLGGAQQSAAVVNRRNTNNLADLGVLQDSANSAESVALRRLEFEKGMLPSADGFSLSPGQTRYDSQGNIIASAGPDTPSAPASIQEYNFAKQQGYTGTFDEFKNSGGSTNPNAILSPTEAQALGVPYGTTRQAAYGTNPQKYGADTAKVLGIATTIKPEINALKAALQKDYRGALLGITTGTNRELVKLVDQVADKVGRLRSGGAINTDEAARFKAQIASLMDIPFGNSAGAVAALDGLLAEADQVAGSINPSQRSGSSGGTITWDSL